MGMEGRTISDLFINEQIRDREVRVIGVNGEQLGVMPTRDAMKLAEEAGVVLLVETYGLYADSARLRTLLNRFACDTLAALWDLQHTCRAAGDRGRFFIPDRPTVRTKEEVSSEMGMVTTFSMPIAGT